MGRRSVHWMESNKNNQRRIKLQFGNGKEKFMSFSLGDETIFSSAREDRIKEIIPDCLSTGTYNIGFRNKSRNDETQFYAENGKDLRDLWKDFCKENKFDYDKILYCERVTVGERNLEIALLLTSDNTFDIEIYEPEYDEYAVVHCHDTGDSVQDENERVMREIRSWVSIMREQEKEI